MPLNFFLQNLLLPGELCILYFLSLNFLIITLQTDTTFGFLKLFNTVLLCLTQFFNCISFAFGISILSSESATSSSELPQPFSFKHHLLPMFNVKYWCLYFLMMIYIHRK